MYEQLVSRDAKDVQIQCSSDSPGQSSSSLSSHNIRVVNGYEQAASHLGWLNEAEGNMFCHGPLSNNLKVPGDQCRLPLVQALKVEGNQQGCSPNTDRVREGMDELQDLSEVVLSYEVFEPVDQNEVPAPFVLTEELLYLTEDCTQVRWNHSTLVEVSAEPMNLCSRQIPIDRVCCGMSSRNA